MFLVRRRPAELRHATLIQLVAKPAKREAVVTLTDLVPQGVDRSPDARRVTFSATKVNRVVGALANSSATKSEVRRSWLSAVATRVVAARPDIAPALLDVLEVGLLEHDHLKGLTIGEVSVCYEALLSELDRDHRKSSGQFFTPDDAADFMAQKSLSFGAGVWLDPCCGVGNLAWHLTGVQNKPGEFVREHLVLLDRDETALKSAIALIAADYAAEGDQEGVRMLARKAVSRDFLTRPGLPAHDFMILNPPYARADEKVGYETSRCRDLFAYFMERVAKTSRGYISVTPASYLSAPKFQSLRDIIDREGGGGDVYVFDNVPDTLFRGYKFGSNNSSKTNFVRAAVTVSKPQADGWSVTPIIRWQAAARAKMFEECGSLLAPRRLGPHGEWAKLGPGLEEVWDALLLEPTTIHDLVTSEPTEYRLDVGLTPRYYISATYRSLDRGSKATLHFRSAKDRDRAAVVLNSSVPYLWWRALDGGVTLPRRVLMSVPVPPIENLDPGLLERLRESEEANLVIKLNAGRENENVKHPEELVQAFNDVVLPHARDLRLIYANSMFPLKG